MKYRLYTGDQPILEAFLAAGIVTAETLPYLKKQEFEAESDEEAIDGIEDFMDHTGIMVKVITRIGTQGEEIIVHRLGN